jgi:GT2 family glycosyltransferase
MVSVSIIIVNYNSYNFTLECIKSIVKMTNDISYEIIVVDNASLNFNENKLLQLSENIRVIINTDNLGFAKANNIGVENSQGEAILLLNNDTILLNDAISTCYYKLKEDKSLGTIGCKLLNENLTWQKSFYEFPTLKTQLRKLLRIKDSSVNGDSANYVPWLTGAFLMFRKSSLQLFQDTKLDEDFFMYCEDIQWGLQFRKNGLKALYYPTGEVVHYQGKSSNFDDDFNKKIKYYYPNLMKLLKMEYSWFYAKSYFLLLILTFLTDIKNNSYKRRILPLLNILNKY